MLGSYLEGLRITRVIVTIPQSGNRNSVNSTLQEGQIARNDSVGISSTVTRL